MSDLEFVCVCVYVIRYLLEQELEEEEASADAAEIDSNFDDGEP